MKFLYLMLVLAQTGITVQSNYFYNESVTSFNLLDKNNNSVLEFDETVNGFNHYKKNKTDSEVFKKWFVEKLVANGTSEDAAGKLFGEYDFDGNGVLNLTDYQSLYIAYDSDKDGKVFLEEFSSKFIEMLTESDIKL